MQESYWNISTNSKSQEKCMKIMNKVFSELNIAARPIQFEKHHETKEFSAGFTLEFNFANKEQLMFELIRLGQQIGYQWELNGSIEVQTAAYSQRSRISGVDMAEWHVDLPEEWRNRIS